MTCEPGDLPFESSPTCKRGACLGGFRNGGNKNLLLLDTDLLKGFFFPDIFDLILFLSRSTEMSGCTDLDPAPVLIYSGANHEFKKRFVSLRHLLRVLTIISHR
jgi:hypothetical protein